MNTINKRLFERLQAAHIAIAYLKEAESGKLPPDLPKGVKDLSLNQLIDALGNKTETDVNSFETRIFRPSLPVIHLASAMAINMTIGEKFEGRLTSLGDIVFSQRIIEDIIQKAELYESLLAKSRLNVNTEKLIRIRLA